MRQNCCHGWSDTYIVQWNCKNEAASESHTRLFYFESANWNCRSFFAYTLFTVKTWPKLKCIHSRRTRPRHRGRRCLSTSIAARATLWRRTHGIGFSRTEAIKFVRYLETLVALSLYNVRVWSSNVDEKAFHTLSNGVLETRVAQAHPGRPWFEKWTLDLIIAALKEVYDPHRFDTSADKWRHWIRTNKLNLHADYKNLEGFRSKYPDALTDAAVDFGEPPAAQRKETIRDLKGILTAPENLHRDSRANNEF